MDNVEVKKKKYSIKLEMEPGTYKWCACGLSKTQPFCDGSHSGTGINPIEFAVTEKKIVSWCGCKRSNNGALCDGSHKAL